MADQTRKQSLSSELQGARSQMGNFVVGLREDLDVGTRLKSNYSSHPGAWFGGAAVLGLLLSRIVPSRRKAFPKLPSGWNYPIQKTGKFGTVLSALKFVFTVAQPAIAGLMRKRIESRVAAQNPPR